MKNKSEIVESLVEGYRMDIGDYDSRVLSMIFCSGTYYQPVFISRGSQRAKGLYKLESKLCEDFGSIIAFTGDTEW